MWPSARFRRSANVLGLSSVDLQKSLKNFRTISRRRAISCWLAEASDVTPIWRSSPTAMLSREAGIPQFHWIVRMRTVLPLTGQCLDELDSDFDPTRHRHIEPLP